MSDGQEEGVEAKFVDGAWSSWDIWVSFELGSTEFTRLVIKLICAPDEAKETGESD
jgi:hypothetical protein